MTFTKERIIEELKASTQNSSGMFEISEDTICNLMSLLTAPPAPVVPENPPEHLLPQGNSRDATYRRGATINGWNACRAAMLAAVPQQGAK